MHTTYSMQCPVQYKYVWLSLHNFSYKCFITDNFYEYTYFLFQTDTLNIPFTRIAYDIHAGVGLEGETKERFNKLQLEIADIKTKFSNNILDSTKAFKLKLASADQVAGLPDSAKKLYSQQAVRDGKLFSR